HAGQKLAAGRASGWEFYHRGAPTGIWINASKARMSARGRGARARVAGNHSQARRNRLDGFRRDTVISGLVVDDQEIRLDRGPIPRVDDGGGPIPGAVDRASTAGRVAAARDRLGGRV